eukprot:6111369-Pleurochrysis_carterae.AAC.1
MKNTPFGVMQLVDRARRELSSRAASSRAGQAFHSSRRRRSWREGNLCCHDVTIARCAVTLRGCAVATVPSEPAEHFGNSSRFSAKHRIKF